MYTTSSMRPRRVRHIRRSYDCAHLAGRSGSDVSGAHCRVQIEPAEMRAVNNFDDMSHPRGPLMTSVYIDDPSGNQIEFNSWLPVGKMANDASPGHARVDHETRSAFRRVVESGTTLVVPGASSALSPGSLKRPATPRHTYRPGIAIPISVCRHRPASSRVALTSRDAHVVDTPFRRRRHRFGDAVNTWHTFVSGACGRSAVQIEDRPFRSAWALRGKSTSQRGMVQKWCGC